MMSTTNTVDELVIQAISNNNIELVKNLVHLVRGLNNDKKLIGTAVEKKNPEMIKILVENGVVYGRDDVVNSILKFPKLDVIQSFGPHPDTFFLPDIQEITLLMHMCTCRSDYNETYLDYLIQNTIRVNGHLDTYDKTLRYTALIYAVANNNSRAVYKLLVAGADPHIEQKAIPLAIASSNLETIQSILRFYTQKNKILCTSGQTPLVQAIGCQRLDVIYLLLQHGVDVNGIVDYETALTRVTSMTQNVSYQLDVVRLLLEYGADVTLCNAIGNCRTPEIATLLQVHLLVMAVGKKDLDQVSQLLKDTTTYNKTTLNQLNVYGSNLLMSTISPEMIKLLVAPASIWKAKTNGETGLVLQTLSYSVQPVVT